MDNKTYKIGYEQTDKELIVEIYGLNFKVRKMSAELKRELEELTNNKTEDFDMLYKVIDKMLEDGASEKINNKRKQDGYDNMSFENIITIVSLIASVQAKEIAKAQIKGVNDTREIFNNYQNRDYRRNNYRGYNNRRY